jgi:hypothetical protein
VTSSVSTAVCSNIYPVGAIVCSSQSTEKSSEDQYFPNLTSTPKSTGDQADTPTRSELRHPFRVPDPRHARFSQRTVHLFNLSKHPDITKRGKSFSQGIDQRKIIDSSSDSSSDSEADDLDPRFPINHFINYARIDSFYGRSPRRDGRVLAAATPQKQESSEKAKTTSIVERLRGCRRVSTQITKQFAFLYCISKLTVIINNVYRWSNIYMGSTQCPCQCSICPAWRGRMARSSDSS